MTTLKNKKIKSKLPVKPPPDKTKPKSLPVKAIKDTKPKSLPAKPKKPIKPQIKSKVKLIVEFDKADKEDNPGKYLDKLKKLFFKIKNQTLETDNRIRFGWKF